MTNYVSQYNFMDLLKDNSSLPQPEVETISYVAILRGLVEQFSLTIEQSYESHNFMDLLYDKGHVPAYCNDNYLTEDAA